jgi:superoxide dismutase, Fe-Mn family
MQYTLPELSYPYEALEPHIDATTMKIHHTKHHRGYTDKFNAVLESNPAIAETPVEELLQNLSSLDIDDSSKNGIRNNGGGYLNHKLFWDIMGPEKQVDDDLVKDIETSFGSVDTFKEKFGTTAKTHFGSGWAWLVRNAENNLEIYSLPNQDSPLTLGHTPVLCLDIWEHAYYLHYQNKRPDYVDAWWNVLKLL